MNIAEQGRLGKIEQVVVALDFPLIVGKPITPEGFLVQLQVLDHGPHSAIKNHNAFLQGLVELVETGGAISHRITSGYR